MSREGFYSVVFPGRFGRGAGMVVLDDGLVIGADPDGSRYDGTYIHNPTANTLECDITVMLAPGSWAVTRATAGTEWAPFKLKITIPRGPFTDYAHVASTPAGKINLLLSKIRGFPV
jgi:hypothetical protein